MFNEGDIVRLKDNCKGVAGGYLTPFLNAFWRGKEMEVVNCDGNLCLVSRYYKGKKYYSQFPEEVIELFDKDDIE